MIKLIIKVVIVVVILSVLVNDLGVIFMAHFQINKIAEDAAKEAWEVRMLTNDYRASQNSARDVAAQNGAEVSEFDIRSGEIRVEVRKVPNTLILHYIRSLERFTAAVAIAEVPIS